MIDLTERRLPSRMADGQAAPGEGPFELIGWLLAEVGVRLKEFC